MQGITERDIAYDMLFGSKQTAHLYNEASLESSHHNVFHMFRELEHHCVENQHRIWEYLHRRNEYRVDEAHPQQIQETHQRMEHLAQDHLGGVRGSMRGEYPRYGAAAPSGYGTPWPGTTGGYATTGNYGNTGAYGSSGGYGTTTYNQPGNETRTDWGRGETGRGLPDWVREPARR